MNKLYLKLCSLVLTVAMLVNMLPLGVFAQESTSSTSSSATIPTDTTESVAADVVCEIEAGRTEYSKEFLLDNGFYVAAVYADPIHYEEDGEWKEINNTLKSNSNGMFSNMAGVWDVSFPQQLSTTSPITIKKDGYTLSFNMSGELRNQGNLEVMSAENEPLTAVETPITATNNASSQSLDGELINVETTSIVIDNSTQTFAVSSAMTSTGTVQAIDFTEEKASAQYEELVVEKNSSQLLYTNVYNNTDVQYNLQGNKVKESIILNTYDSALRGYRYTLNVGDMIPVLCSDGGIEFYDAEQETLVMYMPSPYLVDEAQEYSYDIHVSLTGGNGVYTLTYILPADWLADSDRAWPVILDPVVSATITKSNVKDRTISNYRTYDYSAGAISCGYSTYGQTQRIFLKYISLPALTASDVIVSASIRLYKPENSSYKTAVEVRKVLGTWEANTITWDNQPAHNITTIEDYCLVQAKGFYTWDITDIARDWYEGENTGLVFRVSDAGENGDTTTWKQFYSSDYGSATYMPNLVITYRNNNGLESYWDYVSSSAGRAGTGYVNSYTGNMVWARGDLGFGGNRMPVSISHVYNLNDAANNDFGMGYGWRTNFNQRVYQWSSDSSYYVWEDADGTSHYFYKSATSTYLDEDGLELTLKTNGTETKKYSITDKNGNVSYFDTNGRLTLQENNQETKSSISITYTTSGQLIDTITDGAGRVYQFAYTDSLLSTITYKGTRGAAISTVTYAYDAEGNLTTVTDADNEQSVYTYSDHCLVTAQDVDGYKLQYTYSTPLGDYQPYRTEKIEEFSGTTQGGELNIEYAHNQTTLTDVNGNVQILQFNNWGNTVSVQDNEGRAQYTKYAINDAADSGKANQLSLSSKLQNTVVNLLGNSSFENGITGWQAAGSNASIEGVSGTAYLGSSALQVEHTGSDTAGGAYLSFAAEADTTYTFSAYVKTGTGSAYLTLGDAESSVLERGSDWTRVEVAYTTTSAGAVNLQVMTEDAGSVYIDCVQLEEFPTASRYNLVENGDFSSNDSWSTSSGIDQIAANPAAPQLDTNVYQITGDMETQKRVSQAITVSGGEGDTFVLSGWAKGDSVPLPEAEDGDNQRQFAIIGMFAYSDGTTSDPFIAQFNPDMGSPDADSPDTDSNVNWQYVAEVMVAEKAYDSITVELAYDYNANTVFFDGIQLFKENFGSSYAYDDEGNVTSVVDLQKKQTSYEYDENNNLTSIIEDNKAKMTYTYDDYHNVIKAESGEGLVYEFTYDTYGNNTAVSISGGAGEPVISSTATYSEDGNRLVSTADAVGNVTTYQYNADTNMLEWVKYPEDTSTTKTTYTYDTMYRMASAATTTDTGVSLSANYTYENDLLTEIETASTIYTFGYGIFGLRKSVSVGNLILASYIYTGEEDSSAIDDRNFYLESLEYGNGDSVEYTYDDYGRVTKQTYEDGDTVSYQYDNSGALATVTDSATGITTTYYYDFLDRVMRHVESGANYSHSVSYGYDTINNLTSLVETINGTTHTTSYTYDDDNRITSVNNGVVTKEYAYDAYGRTDTQATKNGNVRIKTDSFEFSGTDRTFSNNTCDCGCEYCCAPSDTSTAEGTYTTGQIENHIITIGSNSTRYTYTYDNNGNITGITQDGVDIVSYVYDSANQLIRENNRAGDFTHTWTYNNAGNITARTEYDYTTGELGTPTDTIVYTYGNINWGDLLTAYDGQTIDYDTIGNPLSDGTWTYTWQHGRQLASMDDGTTEWNFTYNADGLRTSRTGNGLVYDYVYNGSQLTQMTLSTVSNEEKTVADTLYFAYDASGTPMAVTYNGTTYYYVTNIQGDVIGILDGGRNQVASYIYDAWGNILSTDGTMKDTLGALNPLRYRGYAYDTETELYYLSTRYYSPNLGRFLNADALVSTGQGLLGNNMFTYCGNNPTNNTDPHGTWTIGLSFGGNITFGLGASVSIGVFFDNKGNVDVQWSYAVTGVDNTNTVGAIDLGVGIALQYTDRNTVYDLYGPATYVGASGGPWWYVGADAISFSDASDPNADINGFQITGGVGLGLDVHVVESNTKSVLPQNHRNLQKLTNQQRV